MALKEDKVVPGREERLHACTAFGGTACALGGAKLNACMATQGRSFTQAGLCQLLPTLGMLLTIKDSAVIVHGALGCASAGLPMSITIRLHHLARGDTTAKDGLWFSTNLTESDVVHGGDEKLEQTILEVVQRYPLKSIIVLSSCTPAIIGDDLDGVIRRVRERVKIPVLSASCAGFKTGVWATGYDVAFHAMVHGFIENDPEGAPLRKIERGANRPLVNIINLASMGKPDEDEIKRLLDALGIDTLIGPNFGDRELVRKMTQADLTVSVCPTHDDYFIDYLHREYGIPFVLKDMPIGLANTRRWLTSIASFFGKERAAEELIADEEKRARKEASQFEARLRGRRVFVSAGEFRALVTSSLFQELGMEIIGLRSYHHDSFGTDLYNDLVKSQSGRDFIVDVANFQPFELVNMLSRAKPDLFAGHIWDNVWAARAGIPSLTIFRVFDSYVGYRGFYEVARKADRILRNASYNRTLAQNVESPYRVDWFQQNPFKYIRSETSTQTSKKLNHLSNSTPEVNP